MAPRPQRTRDERAPALLPVVLGALALMAVFVGLRLERSMEVTHFLAAGDAAASPSSAGGSLTRS